PNGRMAPPPTDAKPFKTRDSTAGNVFSIWEFGAQARAHRHRRKNYFNRRPAHVRSPVRIRGGLPKNFQSARGIRRGNGDERRGGAALWRPPAAALRTGADRP